MLACLELRKTALELALFSDDLASLLFVLKIKLSSLLRATAIGYNEVCTDELLIFVKVTVGQVKCQNLREISTNG